jgi:hypothetical protein
MVKKGTDAIAPYSFIKPHNPWEVLRVLMVKEYAGMWHVVSEPQEGESCKDSMDERVHSRPGRTMQGPCWYEEVKPCRLGA